MAAPVDEQVCTVIQTLIECFQCVTCVLCDHGMRDYRSRSYLNRCLGMAVILPGRDT